jgi:predicted metal-binding protein
MSIKEQFEEALRGRAWDCAVMPTSELLFLPEVRKACEVNTCGSYGTNWGCPPGNGTLDELKQKITAFAKAFIFTTKYDLEDSFDIEGMSAAGEIHRVLTVEMQARFGKTNPVYGAGGCSVCKKCAYPAPCRFPDKAVSAVEAAGIAVGDLSKTAGVKYNNGEATVTFFSMILFNEP